MTRWLFVLTFLASPAMLASCESQRLSEPPHALRMHFPKISVYGAYAHSLTVEDLRQIRDAARKRGDIDLPISRVDVERSDHVRVVTADSRVVDHKFYYIEFTLDEKSDGWVINSRSIKKQEGTVATGNEPEGVRLD